MPLNWPESIDVVVKQARFGPGDDDWWESSEKVVANLPDDQLRYLATVGLAELVTQEHRMNRTRHELCIGDQLAIARYPELEPYVNPGADVDPVVE